MHAKENWPVYANIVKDRQNLKSIYNFSVLVQIHQNNVSIIKKL